LHTLGELPEPEQLAVISRLILEVPEEVVVQMGSGEFSTLNTLGGVANP